MRRAVQAEIVAELRNEGATWQEIADVTGLSYSYVGSLISDPDGQKAAARKRRCAGTCRACGAATDGSNGRDKAPRHCNRCAPRQNAVWTKEAIIAAIQDFNARYGRPPGARDWNPAMARMHFRDDIAERFYADGCWPWTNSVRTVFGAWSEAIRAAGFPPLEVGHKYADRTAS